MDLGKEYGATVKIQAARIEQCKFCVKGGLPEIFAAWHPRVSSEVYGHDQIKN